MNLVLLAVAGYLIGTISFTRLAARIIVPGEDISETDFSVPGTEETWTYRGVSATSLLERAGWKWGLAVIVLDALKAFVPTMSARLATGGFTAAVVVAIAVIAGHVWPVWWRFVGGRGQSSLLGALLAIDVLAVPVGALAGAVVGLVVFTSVYFARNIGPALLIPWFGVAAGVGPQLWFAVAVNVIYWTVTRGDVREELRARRARGIPQLGYRGRLALAWHDFFNED